MTIESVNSESVGRAPLDQKSRQDSAITERFEADMESMLRTPGARLAKLMSVHLLVGLLVLSLFAAAVSWSTVSGLALASALSVVTGALAGITLSTLVHEWFHYAGARLSGASFQVPEKLGLFLYDWHYEKNDQRQFITMSAAGSVGGFLSLLFLWFAVPTDNWGGAALRAGVIASIVFAAMVEWPVVRQVRRGADPFTELATIPGRLQRCFIVAGVAGILAALYFSP